MTNFKIFSIYFAVNALFSSLAYAGDGHEEHEEEENAIVLTQQQMRFAGIQTKEVKLESHERFYFAPGK
ncbi:hypothetical protein [Pseudoalteromonas piscicida]